MSIIKKFFLTLPILFIACNSQLNADEVKKILLILPIILIGTHSQLSAEEVKKIGKYKDWEAMIVAEASGKVCFAQSSPILQAPKSNKRDAKLFIAFRPAEKIIDEVSVTAGY